MKNTLFICLFAMFALSGCVDDEEEDSPQAETSVRN